MMDASPPDALDADVLDDAARAIESLLGELSAVASTRRHGEELAAIVVNANAVGIERLVALASDRFVVEADPLVAEVLWMQRPSVVDEGGDDAHALDGGEALDGAAQRIDALLGAIEQTGVPGLVHTAEALVATIVDLYGHTLVRILELLDASGQRATIDAALDDEVVSNLLTVHGMHPESLDTRVRRGLDDLADELGSQPVELISVDGDTVALRVVSGAPRDRWRVRLAAERAVRRVAPDVATITVEGAEAEPTTSTPSRPTGEVIIPLASVGRRRPRPSRWVDVPELVGMVDGEVRRVARDDLALVACRVGNDVYVAADTLAVDGLRLTSRQPPTIEASDGTTLVIDAPLPTQRAGDAIEVAV